MSISDLYLRCNGCWWGKPLGSSGPPEGAEAQRLTCEVHGDALIGPLDRYYSRQVRIARWRDQDAQGTGGQVSILLGVIGDLLEKYEQLDRGRK